MELLLNFLITNYLIVLAVAVIGNIVSGSARAISEGNFSFGKFIDSVKDLILLGIGYLAFGIFAFFIKDIKIADFAIFGAAFAFITIAIIVYKGNSLAINFVALAKIPPLEIMNTLDAKVKEVFARENPTGLDLDVEQVVEDAI